MLQMRNIPEYSNNIQSNFNAFHNEVWICPFSRTIKETILRSYFVHNNSVFDFADLLAYSIIAVIEIQNIHVM